LKSCIQCSYYTHAKFLRGGCLLSSKCNSSLMVEPVLIKLDAAAVYVPSISMKIKMVNLGPKGFKEDNSREIIWY